MDTLNLNRHFRRLQARNHGKLNSTSIVIKLNKKLSLIVKPKKPLSTLFLSLITAIHIQSVLAELPTGGQVIDGRAVITQPTSSQLQIDQSTNSATINWLTYGVGAGNTVSYNLPSASGITLNIVVGGNMSEIAGNITSNGQFVLVNPLGIYFANGSQISTGGLIASTLSIDSYDLAKGNFKFSSNGTSGSIVNDGSLLANAGSAVLMANNVYNNGTIQSIGGSVAIGAGSRVTLDRFGDGLVTLSVDAASAQAAINNAGTIIANGGSVELAVNATDAVYETVINTTGVIYAKGLSNQNGRIVLDGGDTGVVEVNGTLDASNQESGGIGGTIKVLGDKVALMDNAVVNVSGINGGGTALIGGNYLGQGPEQNATATYVAQNAVINADATQAGDGGKVIVWGTDYMHSHGTMTARGGALSGNGGFIETSSHRDFLVTKAANTYAANGISGTWLIDPADLTINNATNTSVTVSTPFVPTADGASISWNTINSGLASGNVQITTVGTVGTGSGTITIATAGTLTNGNELTLNADGDIVVNAGITRLADGNLKLIAQNDIAVNADITLTANSTLTLTATSGSITQSAGAIAASTLTGSAGTSVSLNQSNTIANLGAFTTNGAFTLNDITGGLNVIGAVNSSFGATSITTAGGALALGTNSITSAGASLTGEGVTSSAGSTVNAGAGTILVDGNDGAINLAGNLTTTNATASAVTIQDATTAALGSINTGAAGRTTVGGSGGNNITGAVTQTGVINTGTLVGNTTSSVSLAGNNTIANLGAFTTNGAFTLNDTTGGLNVTGAVTTTNNGLASITTTGGNLAVTTGSVAGNGVTLVTTGANDITLAGNVNGNAGDVTLTSGQAISQSAGVVNTTGALTGSAGTTASLNQSNTIANLGAFTTNGAFTLNDTTGGLNVTGAVNSGTGSTSITTAGADLSVSNTGSVAGNGIVFTTNAGSNLNIEGNLNANAGNLTFNGNQTTQIAGSINAANVINTTSKLTIGGNFTVNGNLNANNNLEILSTGNVNTNSVTPINQMTLNSGGQYRSISLTNVVNFTAVNTSFQQEIGRNLTNVNPVNIDPIVSQATAGASSAQTIIARKIEKDMDTQFSTDSNITQIFRGQMIPLDGITPYPHDGELKTNQPVKDPSCISLNGHICMSKIIDPSNYFFQFNNVKFLGWLRSD